MNVTFTKGIQLGVPRAGGLSFRFEKTLVEMTRMLGRPLPEIRGGIITGTALDGEWLAEVTIRAPLAHPDAEVHIFQIADRSWA